MILETKSFCDRGKNWPNLIENPTFARVHPADPPWNKRQGKLFPAGISFPEIQGGKQQIAFSSGGWTHLRE